MTSLHVSFMSIITWLTRDSTPSLTNSGNNLNLLQYVSHSNIVTSLKVPCASADDPSTYHYLYYDEVWRHHYCHEREIRKDIGDEDSTSNGTIDKWYQIFEQYQLCQESIFGESKCISNLITVSGYVFIVEINNYNRIFTIYLLIK